MTEEDFIMADISSLDPDVFAPPGLISQHDRETVLRKFALITRCLPIDSIIDFGGMWEVDGLYSRLCKAEFGIPRVTMVDKFESENWQRNSSLRVGIDFRKGDFSDEKFMTTITQPYDLALAYDILPHQINMRHALFLMLSKTKKYFLISQAILPEELMPFHNCIVLLSGSMAHGLIPFHEKWTRETNYWANFSDATIIDTKHWLWGMTSSFLESLMAGFGWKLIHKEVWRGWLPSSSKWKLCGLIFTSQRGR